MTGTLLALLSALFFGLYIVPRKLSKLPAVQFSTLMALGFTIGSLLLYIVQTSLGNNEGLSNPHLWYAVLAGVFWASALVLLVKSIDLIGIARSNQWKNLQGPVGVILALVILNETTSVNPLLAILSGVAIFGSAIMFNIHPDNHSKKTNRKAITLAVTSGILFGTVSLINKYVTDNAGIYSQQVVWSTSILLSLAGYQLATRQWSNDLLKKGKDTLF
jgi:drug/metabolite transporter (DMT)-like permease